MKIKQRYQKHTSDQKAPEQTIYCKNPRFKLQKLLRSRINQLKQQCVVLKSFQSLSPDKNDSERQIGLTKEKNQSKRYRSHNKNQILSEVKTNHKTEFSNVQTIDVIKQEISKTLSKDLLSLKNFDDPSISLKTKNSLKIKLFPSKRRSWTINYNECCSLAASKCQQELILDSKNQKLNQTPKLCVYEGRSKVIAPLIYFLKKKQISERNVEPIKFSDRLTQRKAKHNFNSPDKKYSYLSGRKKQIQELRQQAYSPWQMNDRNDGNHEINDYIC